MASLIASSRPLCTLTTYQRLLLGLGCGVGDASATAGACSGRPWACGGSAAAPGASGEPEGVMASGPSTGVGEGTEGDSCWASSFCSSDDIFKTPMGGQLSTDFHITSMPNR